MPNKPSHIITEQVVTKEKLNFARRLRKEMSPVERRLWSHLRNDQTGFHFRRQQVVGQYVADFYCHRAGLAVEVDGDTHQNADCDAERDRSFADKGIRVLRFTNLDVVRNIDGVLEVILEALKTSP